MPELRCTGPKGEENENQMGKEIGPWMSVKEDKAKADYKTGRQSSKGVKKAGLRGQAQQQIELSGSC